MGDEISVTIIATGFKPKEKKELAAKDDKAPARNEQAQSESVIRGSVLDAYVGFQEAQEVQKIEAASAQEIAETVLEKEVVVPVEAAPQAAISLATKEAVKEAVAEYATHDIGYERSEALLDLDVPTYLRKQQQEEQL